jgi:anti-anti-sigma factor
MDQTGSPLYQIEQRDGATVVRFLRRHLDQTDVEEFARALEQLIAPAAGAAPPAGPRIVIDLAMIEFTPSRLLGVLVALHAMAQKKGGTLRLCAARPQVMELFTVTRLATVLHIDGTLDESLQKLA